jgi:uncharacterized protein (TIGR00251 family)
MTVDLRRREAAIELPVLVQPRSARQEVGGAHKGALRVRVHAPPVGGEANEAVRRALAKALGIAASRVRVLSGQRGRRKRIRIEGPASELEGAVRELCAAPREV